MSVAAIRPLVERRADEGHAPIVLMTTHNPVLFHEFDRILFVDGGVVRLDGSPETLERENAEEIEGLLRIAAQRTASSSLSRTQTPSALDADHDRSAAAEEGEPRETSLSVSVEEGGGEAFGKTEEEEDHHFGKVSKDVYLRFFREGGYLKFGSFALSIGVSQVRKGPFSSSEPFRFPLMLLLPLP